MSEKHLEENHESKDPSIHDMADLVLASLEEGYKSEGEAFEVYAQKLKSHIHTNPDVFKHRFIKGYELLVDLLNKSDKIE